MITETESGLTTAQYSAIQAATENLSLEVLLQRYGPVWTSHDTNGTRTGSCFDAAIASTYLLRVYVGDLSTVQIDRLANESGGDQVWTVVGNTLSDVDTAVPPSLVTNGLTARLFYYSTGGKIRYSECADISSGTFGAAQDVATVSGIIQLAAVSTTKVYCITKDGTTHNRRLHFYSYSGSWSLTSSQIRWGYPVYGFDAVSLADRDLLMMTSELPPLLGSRAVGTTISTEVTRVQGLVTFQVKSGRWSDHELIDVIDRVETNPSRAYLRLSYINSVLFATYTRCGGDGDYTYSKLAVSRSKDGVSWEFPELIETATAPGLVLPRTDYLYLVGIDRTLRSPCCAWAGQTPVQQDVTTNVLAVESMAAEIRDTTLGIANVGGEMASTLATSNARIQAIYSLGYVTSGDASDNMKVQVSTEDVLIRAGELTLPRRGLSLTTQDRLGRLNRVTSDYAAEWPSQMAGRDPYDDPTGTGYGGLRHTAPYEGSWKASSGACHLLSSNQEGIAVSTLVTDALNGSAQTGFKLVNTGKNEYAGIAFHVYDKDNHCFAAYYVDDDVIRLKSRQGGDDTTLATSGTLSWTVGTWYYLKVMVFYSMAYVFKSTDGVAWTLVTWASGGGEMGGMADEATAPAVTPSGKFGLIGFGYAPDDDTWGDWTPTPWPEPEVPTDWGMLVLDQEKIARSFNFFDVGQECAWEDITGSMEGDKLFNVHVGSAGQAYVTTDGGVYYTPDIAASSISWSCIKTLAAARTETGNPSGLFMAVWVDGSTVYLPFHEWDYWLSGYYSGTAGGIGYTEFSKYGTCNVSVKTTRCGYAAYAGGGTVYFACAGGGCGEALLWAGGAYTQFVGVGQTLQAVKDGFVLGWNGQLYSNYDPGSLYTTDVTSGFGVDVQGGTPLYMKSLHRYLYRGGSIVADAQAVFVDSGAAYGGRAIYPRSKVDEMVWVARDRAGSATFYPRFCVYTTDGFSNWYDRTGDYFDVLGDWIGADGSLGGNGNAVCLAFAY